MTRDEAIRIELEDIYGILDEHHPNYTVCKPVAARNIDRYARLGMLKLDEPPTFDEKINLAINTYLFTAANKCAGGMKSALTRAGLKIVEA